jgi:hypothetical protein
MGSRSKFANAPVGSVGLKRSVSWSIAVLLVSGGLALATAAGTAHTTSLANKACTLLIASKTPGVPERGPDEEILNSCTHGVCLTHYTDTSGQKRCAYSLSAFVKLQCAGTVGEARAFVHRQLRKGYRRVNVGADIAGIVSSSQGAGVVLAVGRAIVLFTEGASSDDNPHPTFPGARRHVIRGARNFIPGLRRGSRHVC